MHQLALVTQDDALDLSMRFLCAVPAHAAFKRVIAENVGLPEDELDVKASSRARRHSRHVCRIHVFMCWLPLLRFPPRQICSIKDVVLLRSLDSVNFVVGQALQFGTVSHGWPEEESILLVGLWDFESYDATGAVAVYRKSEATAIVPLKNVLASVVHCAVPGGKVRALIPYEYQGMRAVAA